MSFRGILGAWSRLSRLNSCPRCGHTWYARGHRRSRACPACHQSLAAIASSAPSGGAGGGCLVALAISFLGFLLVGFTVKEFGAVAVPVDFGIFVIGSVAALVLRQRRVRAVQRAQA